MATGCLVTFQRDKNGDVTISYACAQIKEGEEEHLHPHVLHTHTEAEPHTEAQFPLAFLFHPVEPNALFLVYLPAKHRKCGSVFFSSVTHAYVVVFLYRFLTNDSCDPNKMKSNHSGHCFNYF